MSSAKHSACLLKIVSTKSGAYMQDHFSTERQGLLTDLDSLTLDTTPALPVTIYNTTYRLTLQEVDALSLPAFSKLCTVSNTLVAALAQSVDQCEAIWPGLLLIVVLTAADQATYLCCFSVQAPAIQQKIVSN